MTNRTEVSTTIKTRVAQTRQFALPLLLILLCLCGLPAFAAPSPQEEKDSERRLWNQQFQEARKKTIVKARTKAAAPQPAAKQETKPAATNTSAPPAQAVNDELLGVTLWRLRKTAGREDQDKPRLMVQKDEYVPERVNAATPLNEGQLARLSIEAPRETDGYLYVIDRELYADGTTSEPYLIFPSQSTPPGGNVMKGGKVVYVPAQGDPLPYFTLRRSRQDQVGEELIIIVSPEPLPAGVGLRELDRKLVAQWEKQWGAPTERREAQVGADKDWTKAEQEAGENERLLTQGDPLPQTIYRVKTKPGNPLLLVMPLRIAR
ncbi:MAG: hypothetical protein ACREEM_22915 [Blastocatellia bacterium]